MSDEIDEIDYSDAAWCHSERDRAAVSARQTLQGCLDHMFISVVEQGKLSMSPNGACMYTLAKFEDKRGFLVGAEIDKLNAPDNTCIHCAAGHLFTDAELKLILAGMCNTKGLNDVLLNLPLERTEWLRSEHGGIAMTALLSYVQSAHDMLVHAKPLRDQWIKSFRRAVDDINDRLYAENGDLTGQVNADIVSSWIKQQQEQGLW